MGYARTTFDQMISPCSLEFAWIVDFPLFEQDKTTGEVKSSHHPFTMPDMRDPDELVDTVESGSFDWKDIFHIRG